MPITPTRRSGWTASSSTGTRPRCTSSRTACTTAWGSSRASAPTRPPTGRRSSACATTSTRLFRGARILAMEMPFNEDELFEAIRLTVRASGLDSCYIRPLAYLGYGEMGLNPLLCKVQRCDRRLALGRLPRRRGHRERASASRSARGPATTRVPCRRRPRRRGCTSTPRSPRSRRCAPATTRRSCAPRAGYLGGHGREPLRRPRRPALHAAGVRGRRARGHHRGLGHHDRP